VSKQELIARPCGLGWVGELLKTRVRRLTLKDAAARTWIAKYQYNIFVLH